MLLLFSFNRKDANHVDVTLVWFFDFFHRPVVPLGRIVFEEFWTLMKGEQLVEIARVDAPTAHVGGIFVARYVAPLISFGITDDFTHTIVNEHFKLASAGVNPHV